MPHVGDPWGRRPRLSNCSTPYWMIPSAALAAPTLMIT